MTSAPDLHASPWCNDMPGIGRRRLVYLLLVSLALHLVLIACPFAGPASGDGTLRRAADVRLTAILAGQRAVASLPTRHADKAGHAASLASPTPAEPTADAAAGRAQRTSPASAPGLATAPAPLAALPLALPPATLYYPADQLTARPRALGEPLLDPQELAAFVASGEITLTLWIDARGEVAGLNVEDSDLPAAFAQSAAAAFRELRFAPGEIDGQPVGSVLRIAVRYDDERLASDRDAAPASTAQPPT